LLRTIVIILALCSCTFERLFPEDVANGIARLSVNNMGNLLRALNHSSVYDLPETDKRLECNFRSLELTDQTTITNEAHGKGHVQRRFQECVYDFGKGLKIDIPSLCGKQTATLFGKVVVSGTRTMSGILTGNHQTPVIPSGDAGIQFAFEKVHFHNFRVESSGIDKAMTIASGSAAFEITVHLAKSQSNGMCEIPLPNLTLSNIQYSKGAGASETIVRLPGPFGEFSASIDNSDFDAQVGVYQGQVNHMEGDITIWGKTVRVPGSDPGLNPSFSVNAYQESLECTPDLYAPVEDSCPFEPNLAEGVSRLTMRNLGNLILAASQSTFEHARPECKLGSFETLPTEEYPLGNNQVELVWKFKDCDFEFKNHPGAEKTHLNGRVRLSGERRIKGFHLKGNNKNPVIPGKGGVRFSFSRIEFDNYAVKTQDSDKSLKIAKGSMSFDAIVHLAKSKSMNVCSTPLPNLTLDNIKYAPSDLTLETQFGDINLAISDSLLFAQVYRHMDVENRIEGHVNIFGEKFTIAKNSKLDPQYETSDFDKALKSTEDLLMPVDYECEAYDPIENKIADGIARLTINNLGRMLSAVALESTHERPECQLGELSMTSKASIDYQHKSITWRFDDCEFNLGGKVRLSGTKTISGFLTGNPQYPIVPQPGSTAQFDFSKAEFENYRAEFDKSTHLTFLNATLAFGAKIRLAKDKSTGLCSVPAPNLAFHNIRYLKGSPNRVMIAAESFGIQQLMIDIENSNFDAQFGFGETVKEDNALKGNISILGKSFSLPSDGLGLNPFPDHAAAFETFINATPNLASTDRNVMFQCKEFEYVRALNAARLMILNTGSVTQESHDEYLKAGSYFPGCGFSSLGVRASSKRQSGETGGFGELHFRVNSCKVVNQPTRGFYEKDCLGDMTVFEGNATVSGTQKVVGTLKTYAKYFDDIVPNSPKATSFDFDEISFDKFASYYLQEKDGSPFARLILNGTISAQVQPILSPKKGRPCEFFRSTPVVSLELKAKSELKARLELSLANFSYNNDLNIYSAHLKAQNGVFQGLGNSINGEINVNHKTFYFDNEKLNPDYDQDKFDQSYACRELYSEENEYSLQYVIPHWKGWKPDCKS